MKKDKKSKKEKSVKVTNVTNLAEKLRAQADAKNQFDCESIISELNEASKDGEYSRTVQLKSKQALYIKTLGVSVEPLTDKFGLYTISWKNEE